jgi:hypothetical protein
MAKLARKDVGKKGMSGKLADIDVSARHVADMLPTFSIKAPQIIQVLKNPVSPLTLYLLHSSKNPVSILTIYPGSLHFLSR